MSHLFIIFFSYTLASGRYIGEISKLALILVKILLISCDKWGFGYLLGWFVGDTDCTLQTMYAWLVRGFGIGMVGILIYRVLHLSLRCDSWYACYVINLVK